MFSRLQGWMDRRIIKRCAISGEQWRQAMAALPLLHGLSDEELQRLQELACLFTHKKSFTAVQGLPLTEHMLTSIALQACLPILHLGLAAYAGWSSIIVYPSGFAPKRIFTDEYGVVHQQQTNLSGEAWLRGPVLLNWQETEVAGRIDGHNLVIHEFAHKLDMQNGVANGFPPLHAGMRIEAWVTAFTAGYEHFRHHCSAHGLYGIDAYAATSPAEFFAVFSEVFFERPGLLQRYYVEIYQQLRLYYRQDPLTRLA